MGKMTGTGNRRSARTRSQVADDLSSQGTSGSQAAPGSGTGTTASSQKKPKRGKDCDGDFYPQAAKRKKKQNFSSNKQVTDKVSQDSSGFDEEDGAKSPSLTEKHNLPTPEQEQWTGGAYGGEGSVDMIPATENNQQVGTQTD